ncbi:hypothetical protein [Pedosphaera parvula]|uniref:Uncharacterized protein n=1 Tax=Pedosphaera parvula (strain Ellin514) TaxID=320771 RepID=B9XFV2_PEDPL|nr:hypothetical protein [Pedosphaera parvula]EEF61114.1 hypothetical protein Cflav_PD3831 [Pedosphaera parvula Ellin514]
MKLEYLENGSEDCPLIRLYEFSSADIQKLRAAVMRLIDGSVSRFKLKDIVPVTSIGGVELAFVRGNSDRGVVGVGKNGFEVVLASEGWDRVFDCLEPFLEPSSGYQWLCEKGAANLLLSHDGSW